MRVLHVVAADRWTGAAATALQLVEALRAAGCEAELAFRSGRNLHARLGGEPWAHPILVKERGPRQLAEELTRLRRLAIGVAIVHTHLPHDHLLARLVLRGLPPPRPRLVRSVRHGRHLRPDPFHRLLFRGTAALGLAHGEMRAGLDRFPALRGVPAAVLAPAVEERFRPGLDRPTARRRFRLPEDAVVAGTVGKLARGRGQDLMLHALAAAPGVWGLIVGQGEAEAHLRRLAGRLGVGDRVVLPGYMEQGLEWAYAAMDLLVFPAAGSDHGHRAIAEAAACGVPTLAARLPGVAERLGAAGGSTYPPEDAAALAVLLAEWGADPERRRRAGAAAAARAALTSTADVLARGALALYALPARPPAS